MRINEHTALVTPKVLLVPYSTHHVPTYHEWMQDEELQKATASEPLTIEEEYAMQLSWRQDADKLTFIVCTAAPDATPVYVEGKKDDSPTSMIGDVNLFLCPCEDEDEEPNGALNGTSGSARAAQVVGEVEIMIASLPHQGQGLGKAILLAFLSYIRRHLDAVLAEYAASLSPQQEARLSFLRVKIGAENGRSVRLFESVGFVKVSETPNFFGEVELRLPVEAGWGEGVEGEVVEVPFRVVGG